MIPRLELIERGARVAYEDAANPRREGRVVGIRAGELFGTEYRVRWDDEYRFDGVAETTSDLRQSGWAMLADLPGNPFDGAEILSVYTRLDAIRDGEIVPALDLVPDEPLFVQQAGWTAQVDLTRAVAELVVPNEREQERGQSAKGRLWDLLSMARMYAPKAGSEHLFPCLFYVLGREGIRGGTRTYHLRAAIGPDDDGEPVVTILLRGES